MRKLLFCLLVCGLWWESRAQFFELSGVIKQAQAENPISNLIVELERVDFRTKTDSSGFYRFPKVAPGRYKVVIKSLAYERKAVEVEVVDRAVTVPPISLRPFEYELQEVRVGSKVVSCGIGRLHSVDGVGIYDGKKNEVVLMKETNLCLSTNSSRQIFAKVPGVNIWESDAAGLQIGIATRGLDPNRTSNFNTRQNGYDISADALGYPDSYYVPPAEAVDRVEVIRGAASLQYGPQFGGMLNYVLSAAPTNRYVEWTSYTTLGSYKTLSLFNSVGGTLKRFSYYAYHNYKQGNSWRPNGAYRLHNAHLKLAYQITEKINVSAEYTLSNYLTQQSGGLTDAIFNQNAKQSFRTRNWFATDWNILALQVNYRHNAFHQMNVRAWGFLGSRDAVGYLGPANRQDDMARNRDLIKDKYRNLGVEARYIWKYYLKNSLSAWLSGVRVYEGHTQKTQGLGNAKTDADFSFSADSNVISQYTFPGTNVALFTENVFGLLSNKLKITPGARFEFIATKANGFYRTIQNEVIQPTATNETRSFKRSLVLLGIGLSYQATKATELYTNFSQNFRGITFTDMRVVRISQIIDPALRDERGFNLDLGYRGEVNNWLNFDVSGYWLQYNNRIGQIQQVDSAFNIFRYTTNVGTSRSLGAEAFVELDFLNAAKVAEKAGHLSIFVSAAYTRATYIKSSYKIVVGNSLEFAPQLVFRSGITYKYKKFSTTLQGSFTSLQYTDASNATFTANAVNGAIPAYYVMDWNAKYAVKFVQFQLGINNLTNNIYFTRRAVSYPGPGIIPSEPLTVYGTIGIKINEQIKRNKLVTF